jgi:PAS domain S-box-containing protein
VIVPDVSKDQRFDPAINQHLGFVTRAIGCAPIRYRGEVIGVIEALNPLEENFDADALLVLTGIGSLAGAAIRHAQLFERLDAAHARFRGLFEDSIDPILITDWDGKILQTNRRAALVSDYSQADLQQMTIQQFHAIDAEQLGAGFEHLHTGNIYSYESRLRSRCGHEIPIEVHVRKVEMDECVNIQWMLRDITERKNLETLRNDLISMIYHDLRSPLATVVSSLDVLKTMLPGDDHALRSLLEIALRSTERIQRLTESLLDMNRLEAGQPLGNRQMVQPGVLIQEALDAVRPIIDNKHQTAVTEIPEETSPVFVDAEMIRRVLINLLENAAKYTPAGSMLTMGAMNVGEKVQFWIRDNGPGIPTSEHERIFEKFSRLTSKGTPRGFGLGLAYCRLAVEGHGGRIWVESEPGTGACFQFTLPTSAE